MQNGKTEQGRYIYKMIKWELITLEEWRLIRNSSVGQWIDRNQKKI